jgi:hypothetical protein
LQRSPSPEWNADVESSLQRLRNELREERNAAQAADVALDGQYTYAQQAQVARGRKRMQARLADAQRRLEATQRIDRLPDEGAEAESEREIALFEHELRRPWL